ncbi:MAG TPA: cellulase family glycosylhydrolase [Polyangiaceae bacterium]
MRNVSMTLVFPLIIGACSGSNHGQAGIAAEGGNTGFGGSVSTGATSTMATKAFGGAALGGTLAFEGGAANGGNAMGGRGGSKPDGTFLGGQPGLGGATNTGGRTFSGGSSNQSGGSSTVGGYVATGGIANTGGRTSSANGGAATGGVNTGGRPSSANGGSVIGGASAVGIGGVASGGETTSSPEPFVRGTPPTAAKYFKKGINFGNRLEAPNEGDWGSKILATDMPFIANRGFDHVRIPIRFSGHAAAASPYAIEAAFFARIDEVLDQAADAKLAVLIDLHAYDELATSPSSHRERFLSLWSQIASRYRDRPDNVAFELLNEPYGQLDTAWNDVLADAVKVVRATNPRRLLVVDAVYWADPSKLSQLNLPNDANILTAIHLYEPKLFSFQGKSWMGDAFMTTGIVFPGPPASPVTPVAAATAASWAKTWFDAYNTQPAATNPSGPATIATQMAYLTNFRTSTGRAVYNGEWGPQDGGEMSSRARLVTLVRQECEKAGIGWAIWEDSNNMKLYDSVAKTWVTSIVDALLPP